MSVIPKSNSQSSRNITLGCELLFITILQIHQNKASAGANMWCLVFSLKQPFISTLRANMHNSNLWVIGKFAVKLHWFACVLRCIHLLFVQKKAHRKTPQYYNCINYVCSLAIACYLHVRYVWWESHMLLYHDTNYLTWCYPNAITVWVIALCNVQIRSCIYYERMEV